VVALNTRVGGAAAASVLTGIWLAPWTEFLRWSPARRCLLPLCRGAGFWFTT